MRRTKHRRRFHTDRVVAARRARYLRESQDHRNRYGFNYEEWLAKRLSWGRLSTMDPWDCGSACWLCHYGKREGGQRTREERAWRRDWGV
jgi:hypothetical protein